MYVGVDTLLRNARIDVVSCQDEKFAAGRLRRRAAKFRQASATKVSIGTGSGGGDSAEK